MDDLPNRRLTVILAADVAGFSRLMGRDEGGTFDALKALRQELVAPQIKEHGGRIIKFMGDGLLAEFGSVIEAVKCAIEIQGGLQERNRDIEAQRKILLRVGINLGDVIVEGRDIYGDGVNVAARLEGICDAGGLCISDLVYQNVRMSLGEAFEDQGEHALKNIERKIRVWKWTGSNDAAVKFEESSKNTLSLPDKPSIVVLPFTNMSGDPEQGYFADGITEDIITELSRARWLFVIARNSSFAYKDKPIDVKQVGRELGVRYVLEGSVRKASDRVRITGQLVDASNGANLWADRFDGQTADIFDLQDLVTQSVVGAISPRLEEAEIERANRKPTDSLDAYDYYLRGMAAFHQFTADANRQSEALFAQARERDPQFAAAYGMAARCFAQRKGFGWVSDPEGESAEALRLARAAVSLGRKDATALAAGGFALVMVGEVEDGDAFIDRALSLNQNLAWAWHVSGLAKALVGQPDVVAQRAARAMRLSPQDPQFFAMQGIAALGDFFMGRTDEALAGARAALRDKSNFALAAGVIAASATRLSNADEARRAMEHFREINPSIRQSNLWNWLPFRRPEEFDLWSESLRQAGLPAE